MEIRRKRILEGVLVTVVAVILAARFLVPLHYAGVMPRLSDPKSGRIYRVYVGSGIDVYLNKREVNLLDLLNYELSPVAVALMLLLVYFKLRHR